MLLLFTIRQAFTFEENLEEKRGPRIFDFNFGAFLRIFPKETPQVRKKCCVVH